AVPVARMCSSEWHRPAASIRTRTSPALGSSRSSSVISHGVPPLRSTAARVFICFPWLISRDFHITRYSSSKVSYIVSLCGCLPFRQGRPGDRSGAEHRQRDRAGAGPVRGEGGV